MMMEKKKTASKKKAPASRKKGRQGNRKRRKQTGFSGIRAIAGILAVMAVLAALVLLVSDSPEKPEETAVPTETGETLPPNPYAPSDFTYDEDGFLTCSAGDTQMGIDVSDHQGWIDWQQVAGSGVRFAFVRIGYRGYSEGGLFTDEYAHYNLTAARQAGLEVGAYFYSQATTVSEAREEARWCADYLKDYTIDLPVVYDWEYVSQEARTGQMDGQTLTDCADAFCRAMEEAGYEAMVYFNLHLARDYYDLLRLKDYSFWLAMYTGVMDYPNRVDYWQYTDQGSLPGIDTTVDINLRLDGLSP